MCFLFLVAASRVRTCARLTRLLGSASGPCFAAPDSPQTHPFAPRAPLRPRPLCSLASSLLRAGPTSPSYSSSATASGLPDDVPATTGGDGDGDLMVPVQKASAHARVYDDARSACVSQYRHRPCCLFWDGKHQHPELVLRGSIPPGALPCERFASALADNPCVTRGRYGSVPLHRDGLPSSAFCWSPGAPVHHINNASHGFSHGVPRTTLALRCGVNCISGRKGGCPPKHDCSRIPELTCGQADN